MLESERVAWRRKDAAVKEVKRKIAAKLLTRDWDDRNTFLENDYETFFKKCVYF